MVTVQSDVLTINIAHVQSSYDWMSIRSRAEFMLRAGFVSKVIAFWPMKLWWPGCIWDPVEQWKNPELYIDRLVYPLLGYETVYMLREIRKTTQPYYRMNQKYDKDGHVGHVMIFNIIVYESFQLQISRFPSWQSTFVVLSTALFITSALTPRMRVILASLCMPGAWPTWAQQEQPSSDPIPTGCPVWWLSKVSPLQGFE